MMINRISITTGDSDGIGFEVADKALTRLGPKPKHQFIFWRSTDSKQKLSSALKKKFKVITVQSLPEALKVPVHSKTLVEISSSLPPSEWVRLSALAALDKQIQGLCTGPLSKTSTGAGGGHTGIFRDLVTQPLFMFFLGSKFNVLLLTDHIPLNQIGNKLTADRIESAISLSATFVKNHLPKLSKKPIAVLGINPHAGEKGLLGKEENELLEPSLNKLKKQYPLVGPLVPDAAFLPESWKNYSLYIANYHDQGLIPFKMVHGHKGGVHLTLGLPFVRTSVDHGTAKELFGKNKAQAGSMLDALNWAVKLTSTK